MSTFYTREATLLGKGLDVSKPKAPEFVVKHTHAQYMAGECSHADYYGQFVTEADKQRVVGFFGLDVLEMAWMADGDFNTLSLRSWDVLASFNRSGLEKKLAAAGDAYSMGGGVCFWKEVARRVAFSGYGVTRNAEAG